jgi:hypothetical protein
MIFLYILFMAFLPNDIKNIIDDYSSSYEHYQRTKNVLEEYQKRVKPYVGLYVSLYKDAITVDKVIFNWRPNGVYNYIYNGGKIVSNKLPMNY